MTALTNAIFKEKNKTKELDKLEALARQLAALELDAIEKILKDGKDGAMVVSYLSNDGVSHVLGPFYDFDKLKDEMQTKECLSYTMYGPKKVQS